MRPLSPPVAPPEIALRQGWMPLAATGVDEFASQHPSLDGRGVLIAILDSGIDPSVPGLHRTSTGERKIVDLRDFSGEGRVALVPIPSRRDTVELAGHRVAGLSRVRAFDADGPWYSGAIAELDLGDPEAADLNGDGDVADTLPVVVTRASDGWVLFADRAGDGTLANDRPVHDYRVAHEWFGWAPEGVDPYVALAVNFADDDARPVLDLFFDTSGHGTHVAGIAAGHDLYGVAGFDGVAPGAQLLGLKIADDAQGGVSRTGSMMKAIDYAIRTAQARQLPLVLNMSFGVGNEREGAATIDRLIDSTLALHPDLAFTVAAGNDGPGISTLGFPGSARRVVSVGALFPGAFLSEAGETSVPDDVADFSSRGGEVAAPHLVVPGVAYSAVPTWDRGGERKAGTSMAAPHAAGLAARLLSAAAARGLTVSAVAIRQALMATAAPVPGATFIDAGTGVPNLSRAWAWLATHPDVALLDVTAMPGLNAALIDSGSTEARFALSGAPSTLTALSLRTQVPWLSVPRSIAVSGGRAQVVVRPHHGKLQEPGVHVGLVSAWGPDTTVGPLARMVTTVRVPYRGDSVPLAGIVLGRGRVHRVPFEVLPGRPFAIRIDAGQSTGAVAYLHEPGGMPFRGGHARQVGSGAAAASFEALAQDLVPGIWELVIQGSPWGETTIDGSIVRAPVTIAATIGGGGAVQLALTNASGTPVEADAGAAEIGSIREVGMSARGSARQDITMSVPAWARGVQVDILMPAESWPRFTDLGLSLFDEQGRQLAAEPINYAFGRLEHQLEPASVDRVLRLSLYPGFASAADTAPWAVTALMRFYADSARPLVPAGERGANLRPGASGIVTFLPGEGRTQPAGSMPLYLVLVRTGEEGVWAAEVTPSGVPESGTP
jgi:subtilisin family serine protease